MEVEQSSNPLLSPFFQAFKSKRSIYRIKFIDIPNQNNDAKYEWHSPHVIPSTFEDAAVDILKGLTSGM